MKISRLILYTGKPQKQAEFYHSVLGLPVVDQNDHSVEFRIGDTSLIFQYRASAKPYHFAINIPSNREQEALAWLKERVSVLPFHGNELVDFVNWNAKSMYFYDADNNIVEFIARKNLALNSDKSFGPGQLLCISEIGLAVNDVKKTYDSLIRIRDVGFYFGDTEQFCAAGDEYGLFIIIDKQHKGWMPNNDVAHTSDFVMYGELNIAFLNGEIIELNESH